MGPNNKHRNNFYERLGKLSYEMVEKTVISI